MKRKTLKVLSGIMAIAVMTQLVGCTTGTKGNEAENSAKVSQTADSRPTAEVENPTKDFVTLTWYMRKPIDNMKDQEAVEAEANKIIKEKINANLKFVFIDVASWDDKMKMMSAAGEAYDLVLTSSWTNRIDMNVQRGAFKPIGELLDKYGQDIKSKVDPRAWKAATYNGEIMAVPSQSPFSQPKAFVFKKDLVDKYNFDYKSVKTLADLEPYLELIKKNEPGVTPLLATGKMAPGAVNFDETTIINGLISFNEKTGKIEVPLEIPETVSLYRTLYEYYKKGYIAKDASTKTDMIAEAKSGKYAVMSDAGGYTEDGSKSSAQYGFPCAEALFGYPVISTASMTSVCTAISNTSENPERAMMLLNLIWSDKTLMNTLAFGLEGKNYTVTAGKGTDSPTVEAKSGAEQTWAIWHNWLGPLWDQWDSNWNSTAALQQMKDNNDKAKTSAALGFLFNNEPVKSEIAVATAVVTEIAPVLNTGIAPDFDKYVEEALQKLKDAGIYKIRDEAQRQYDEWKANNQ